MEPEQLLDKNAQEFSSESGRSNEPNLCPSASMSINDLLTAREIFSHRLPMIFERISPLPTGSDDPSINWLPLCQRRRMRCFPAIGQHVDDVTGTPEADTKCNSSRARAHCCRMNAHVFSSEFYPWSASFGQIWRTPD